jgi:hypothetical protein
MKRKAILLALLVVAVGWLSYLTGCSLLGVSVDDRVMQFLADINDSDRSQVYLNFHPDILDYSGIQVAAFWDGHFPYANAPYSISALVTGDPANVTFTISASGYISKDVLFVMEKLGNDWMISKMYMDVSPALPPTPLIVD